MSRSADTAAAVVDALNNHTFSVPFEARRAKRVIWDLPDLNELRVTVVSRSLTTERLDRSGWAERYPIEIVVQKKLVYTGDAPRTSEDRMEQLNGIIDPFEDLCEEIRDFLESHPINDSPPIECEQAIYDDDALADHVFLGIMKVTYLG